MGFNPWRKARHGIPVRLQLAVGKETQVHVVHALEGRASELGAGICFAAIWRHQKVSTGKPLWNAKRKIQHPHDARVNTGVRVRSLTHRCSQFCEPRISFCHDPSRCPCREPKGISRSSFNAHQPFNRRALRCSMKCITPQPLTVMSPAIPRAPIMSLG